MKSLSQRDKEAIWHPYTQMKTADLPIALVKGKGAYLFDEKGNRFIDAISSWWVNTHGHSHPHIAKKVSQQLNTLEHAIFAGFTHAPAVELAERILKVLPVSQSKIFYSDNGSTAVEVALKMAFQFWFNKGLKRTKIIAFKNAYHGDTFGAMSVSERGSFTQAFFPFLFEVIFIDAPTNGKEEQSLKQLKDQISKHKAENSIAAFIFEPLVQGAAGMVMHKAEALEKLIKLCKQQRILTIADEVMTGFGRTGEFFATDYITEKPDIFCLSKGLTGGAMAFGVTSCSKEIYNAFLAKDKMKTFFHGHSYTANPIACAAALASMDLFGKDLTWKNIERISKKHSIFAQKVKSNSAILKVSQTGTILALEVKTAEPTSYFNSASNKAYQFFLDRGIILRPLGNVIYIIPPYCIKDKDLNYIYDSISDYLEFLLKRNQ